MNEKSKLQQDLYDYISELNQFKDRGFALADRVGALEMTCCPSVIPSAKETVIDQCGQTLIGSSALFTWTDPSAPAGRVYDLWWNVVNDSGAQTSGNSKTIFGLPTDGSKIALTLYKKDLGDSAFSILYECDVIAAPAGSALSKTFSEIASDADPEVKLENDSDYEAEFLYQTPNVAFWTVDSVNQTVTEAPDPLPLSSVLIDLPMASGSDDSATIQAILNASTTPAGATLRGVAGFPYLISNLQFNKAVKLILPDIIPLSNPAEMFNVNVPDVWVYDTFIDIQFQDVAYCFNIETNNHRFQFVRGGVKNVEYTGSHARANFAAFLCRGIEDIHITANDFGDLYCDNTQTPQGAGGTEYGDRVLWVAGRGTHTMTRGHFSNNDVGEMQTKLRVKNRLDADVVVLQDLLNNEVAGDRFKFYGNRMTESGGRAVKGQSGGIESKSNSYAWIDDNGRYGPRRRKAFIDVQNADNISDKNARLLNSGGYSISGMFSILSNSNVPDNIDFDCGVVEWNHDGSGSPNDFVFFGRNSSATSNSGSEATNSAFRRMTVKGSGFVDAVEAYYEGWQPGSIDTSGNTYTILRAADRLSVNP